jgi:hypothetical protein
MEEYKFLLPYFGMQNEELQELHAEVQTDLLKRYGFVMRNNISAFWKRPATQQMRMDICFEYAVPARQGDEDKFRGMAKEYAKKAKLPHVYLNLGGKIEIIDLKE